MLGYRTKQVKAYGKRKHRIVNVSENKDEFAENEKPVVASMSPLREKTYCDSVSRPVSKLKPGLIASPVALKKKLKRTHIQPIISQHTKSEPSSKFHDATISSPSRISRKPSISGVRHTPLSSKMQKSFTPYTDIITFDSDGHQLSTERRLSPAVASPTKQSLGKIYSSTTHELDDGEDDDDYVPKTKRNIRKASRPIIVHSSGSESEPDLIPLPSRQQQQEKSGKASYPIVVHSSGSEPECSSVPLPTRQKQQKNILQTDQSTSRVTKSTLAKPTSSSKQTYTNSRKSTSIIPPGKTPPKPQARRLTPIRRGAAKGVFGRSLVVDVDDLFDDEGDISLDFADLSLSELTLPPTRNAAVSRSMPVYLAPLLKECGQETPHEFSSFIKSFPLDPVVWSSSERGKPAFKKIGEASYSEVFGIGDVVLKIIPLRDESATPKGTLSDAETPCPSDASDVLREMLVTRTMGKISQEGVFIRLLKGYVVRGRYPELLLGLWDEYEKQHGSESIRPDTFSLSQTYAIIVLPNGGPDLESFVFPYPSKTGWRQACSLFWQVTRALAEAEELVRFEHRDLHWGQILVNVVSQPPGRRKKSTSRLLMDDSYHGVEATIIDLGLARMDSRQGGGVNWTAFEPEVFEGEGDYQFDIYRMMRNHNGNQWESFQPLTNVMWLHYLTQKLLYSKRLRVPKPGSVSSNTFSEVECYDSLVRLEALLAKSVSSAQKPSGKKSAKKGSALGHVSVPIGCISAQGVVEYGIGQGWIADA